MKKTIITSLFLLGIFSQNCFGQLKVDSLGRVGIGTLNTTNSLLTIGQGNGNSIYTATITPPTGKGGLYIQNPATSSSPLGNVGLSITNNNNVNTSAYGIYVNWNHLDNYSYPQTYSIYAEAGGSSVVNYGIAATLSGIGSAYGAAIIGSTSSSPTLQHSGQYAGYFKGDVRSTGTIYSALLSPSPISSSSTVRDLTEDRANVISSRITSLQPIAVISENEQRSEDVVQTKMSSTRYAIDEESLRNLFPELVYEDMDGNVSINYIEMVPLLVQSIKELNAKIESLEKIISTK